MVNMPKLFWTFVLSCSPSSSRPIIPNSNKTARVEHHDETTLVDNWAGIPLPNSVRFSSILRPAERLRDV